MHEDVEKILISEQELKTRVNELAKTITCDYKGKQVFFICILKGASIFFADLVRAVDLDIEFDFMSVSSYGLATASSGEVYITKDVSCNLENKHVIIVEDIIDSGNTLNSLLQLLKKRNPKSLKVCALLDKPQHRQVACKGDYIGFSVPNEFVVGYGLDFNEKYRAFPHICLLKASVFGNSIL